MTASEEKKVEVLDAKRATQTGLKILSESTASGTNAKMMPPLHGVRDGIMKQMLSELVSRGETIRIVAIGESGVGKTTMLSNIFAQDLCEHHDTYGHHNARPYGMNETLLNINLDEVPFAVTLADTCGYGDSMDIERSFRMVTEHIDACNEAALEEESALERTKRYQDCLIDAVLYFFSPHRLKAIDLEMLRRIEGKAPIIPVLAKADTMTTEELETFRAEVSRVLADEKITIVCEPLAVAASVYTRKGAAGETRLGRDYPWGFVDVEDEEYSDLGPLRRCLLTEGLRDLKTTKLQLYENYRTECLKRSQGGVIKKVVKFTVNTVLRVVVIAALAPLVLEAEKNLMGLISGGPEEPPPPPRNRWGQTSRRRR